MVVKYGTLAPFIQPSRGNADIVIPPPPKAIYGPAFRGARPRDGSRFDERAARRAEHRARVQEFRDRMKAKLERQQMRQELEAGDLGLREMRRSIGAHGMTDPEKAARIRDMQEQIALRSRELDLKGEHTRGVLGVERGKLSLAEQAQQALDAFRGREMDFERDRLRTETEQAGYDRELQWKLAGATDARERERIKLEHQAAMEEIAARREANRMSSEANQLAGLEAAMTGASMPGVSPGQAERLVGGAMAETFPGIDYSGIPLEAAVGLRDRYLQGNPSVTGVLKRYGTAFNVDDEEDVRETNHRRFAEELVKRVESSLPPGERSPGVIGTVIDSMLGHHEGNWDPFREHLQGWDWGSSEAIQRAAMLQAEVARVLDERRKAQMAARIEGARR